MEYRALATGRFFDEMTQPNGLPRAVYERVNRWIQSAPPDLLASPIETLDEVSVGYPNGPLVLRKLDLRIVCQRHVRGGDGSSELHALRGGHLRLVGGQRLHCLPFGCLLRRAG